jgi:hypothetical protein
VCGPEALVYIAEFARKPILIKEAISKYEKTIQFKELGVEVEDLINLMKSTKNITREQKENYISNFNKLKAKRTEIKNMSVTDDISHLHAGLMKVTDDAIEQLRSRYNDASKKLNKSKEAPVNASGEEKSPTGEEGEDYTKWTASHSKKSKPKSVGSLQPTESERNSEFDM